MPTPDGITPLMFCHNWTCLHDGFLGIGITEPETDLVALGPDADDSTVDHPAGVLEGLTDQAEQDVKPDEK